MSTIDTSQMDADEGVAYCIAKSLWPDDEASFEREWQRVRHERQLKKNTDQTNKVNKHDNITSNRNH